MFYGCDILNKSICAVSRTEWLMICRIQAHTWQIASNVCVCNSLLPSIWVELRKVKCLTALFCACFFWEQLRTCLTKLQRFRTAIGAGSRRSVDRVPLWGNSTTTLRNKNTNQYRYAPYVVIVQCIFFVKMFHIPISCQRLNVLYPKGWDVLWRDRKFSSENVLSPGLRTRKFSEVNKRSTIPHIDIFCNDLWLCDLFGTTLAFKERKILSCKRNGSSENPLGPAMTRMRQNSQECDSPTDHWNATQQYQQIMPDYQKPNSVAHRGVNRVGFQLFPLHCDRFGGRERSRSLTRRADAQQKRPWEPDIPWKLFVYLRC